MSLYNELAGHTVFGNTAMRSLVMVFDSSNSNEPRIGFAGSLAAR